MGREVCDPLYVEGDIECLPGLGLLPITTETQVEKITCQDQFSFLDSTAICEEYEIHKGTTSLVDIENDVSNGSKDGFYLNKKCFDTYIHGIFDNGAFIDFLLESYAKKFTKKSFDYKAYKQ